MWPVGFINLKSAFTAFSKIKKLKIKSVRTVLIRYNLRAATEDNFSVYIFVVAFENYVVLVRTWST